MSSPSAGRRTRASSSAADALQQMSTRERLLIAQVVYQLGTGNWDEVSRQMSSHPLISRPKSFFSPQSCLAIHSSLMSDLGFVGDAYEAQTKAPKARPNLTLAQTWYRKRVLELKSHIMEEEAKFRALVEEIEDIQAGRWDERLKAEFGSPPRPSKPVSSSSIKSKASPSPIAEHLAASPTPVLAVAPESPPSAPQDALQVSGYLSPDVDEEHQNVEMTLEHVKEPSPVDVDIEETIKFEPIPHVDSTMEDLDDVMMSPAGELPSDDQDVVSMKEELDTPLLRDESVVAATPATPPAEPVPASDSADTPAGDGDGEGASTSRFRQSKRTAAIKGKRRATDVEPSQGDSDREKKRPREASESIDEDEGSAAGLPRRITKGAASSAEAAASKRFQTVISLLHATISQHRNGNIFHNPIKESDAPDYHEIVKRPMDLKTIKSRIKDGLIANSTEFQRDIYLMFANAMMYNRPNSDIYQMAEEMMIESDNHIHTFRSTEGFKVR